MNEEDEVRDNMNKEISEYSEKLNLEMRNRKIEMEKLALTLSRFSPASSFQLATMNMAETDINLKSRYEDYLNEYKDDYVSFVDKKAKETGSTGGMKIEMTPDGGINFDDRRGDTPINYSELPQFVKPTISFAGLIEPVMIDIGLLLFYNIIFFAAAFVGFLRFDLR